MIRFRWVPVVSLFVLSAFYVAPVHAATITVATLTDEDTDNGLCSLREAVVNANAGAVNPDCTAGSTSSAVTDDIVLSAAGTYSLTLGQLSVTFNSKIAIAEAPGVDTAISAGGLSRIFTLTSSSGTALTLTALTLRDGSTASDGGCISLSGSSGGLLEINDSRFENCNAGDQGGAVYVLGISWVVDADGTTFHDNTAGTQGGAVYLNGTAMSLTFTDSTFTENEAGQAGGAVYATLSAGLTITGGTFEGNIVDGGTDAVGGALRVGSQNSTTVSGVTFTGNSVANGTSSNEGGALYLFGGVLNLSGSVFTGNSATGTNARGGAIAVGPGNPSTPNSNLQLSDTRIESNSADTNGGAIYSVADTAQAITTSCIVDNGDLAIYNTGATIAADGGSDIEASNWWGSADGPQIEGAPAGSGSADSLGDSINGDGLTPVDVGLISPGPGGTTPTGSWLVTPPTVAGATCLELEPPTTTTMMATTTIPTTSTTIMPMTTTTIAPTTTTTLPAGGCASVPRTGCRDQYEKARLLIKTPADAAGRKVEFVWKRGQAAVLEDFGDAVGGTAAYDLCVYSAGVESVHVGIPAGPVCEGEACWREAGDRKLVFEDRAGTYDGARQVVLKAGGDGDSGITFEAKGAATEALPGALTTPVVVQLVATDDGDVECWEAAFPSVQKNTPSKFQALDDE